MFAQATTAISMRTAGRPRTDDGSGLRHSEGPVSPCIERRYRGLVTSVADASTIICENAITRALVGEIAMEVLVMMSGMTAMVARRIGIGLKREEGQAKQCDQYRHDTYTIHGVPRALKMEKRTATPVGYLMGMSRVRKHLPKRPALKRGRSNKVPLPANISACAV